MPLTNLPLELTSLVGRARELEELQRLLRDGARFLTLTGPGGSGKTRLAREAARAALAEFEDGALLVSLAPIRDAELVASVIAQAMDLRDTGSEPIQQSLKTYLCDRNLLLLLDNFEQVVEAGPLIADLLSSCPRLRILVTSRAPLRISGEREFPVPPLALPDPHQLPPPDELTRYASVRLFLDRAIAVNPDFDAGSLREVAEICGRLDGLPLAIELAAARSKLLTPSAMLARLDKRLPLLAGGARDLPERQRTLRGAIAWSYDLLGPEEQTLFRRMAVFAGGCDLEAAEAVCEVPSIAPESGQIVCLELISSLLDKNLVRQAEAAGPQPRFGMLETIREFGLELLDACSELDATQQHHAEHFLSLAERASEYIPGDSQESWLRQLEQEHDNFRAALRWQISHADRSGALRLAAALEQFWQFRGYIVEGRAWLEAVLAADESRAMTPERAKALTSLGMLALYQSDFDLARRLHEEARQIYVTTGDEWNVAVATNDLGTVALYRGDYAAARELFETSLKLRLQIGDERGSAVALTNLGIAAQAQGDLTGARRLHEQSLETRRKLGDAAGVARSLTRLGAAATELGDFVAARTYLRESLEVARERHDEGAAAASLTTLGGVEFELGNLSEARALLEEGLVIRRRFGDRAGILRPIWQLVQVIEAQGDLDVAQALWEEGLPIQEETADPRGMALWTAGLADFLVRRGDFRAAQGRYEHSLRLRRRIGDEAGAAVILGRLAQVSLHDGDIAQSRRLLAESAQALRGLDDRQALTAALTNLAQIVSGEGDYAESELLYREALALQQEDASNLQVIVLCLSGLAAAALARKQNARAAVLYGAAQGMLDALDTAAADAAPGLHHVSAPIALDRSELATAEEWANGQAMTLQEAIKFALSGPDDAPSGRHGDAHGRYPDGLSEREVEVLRLMALGRSNPEIAAELFISVNTVYRHVSNIFSKTGATNRVEAATYAQRHGPV